MARPRKINTDCSNIERHVPEDIPPTLSLYCPLLRNGTRDICFCIYKCKKATIAKCQAYLAVYDELLTFHIDEKYILKYGPPVIPIPISRRRRRKRNVQTREETDGTNLLGM